MERTNVKQSRILSQSSRLPVCLSGAHRYLNISGLLRFCKYTEALYGKLGSPMFFLVVLNRTCDRPCEPACRRGRVEEEPVAICRLKRVAWSQEDIQHLMPAIPDQKNGKRVAFNWRRTCIPYRGATLQLLVAKLIFYDDQLKGGRDAQSDTILPITCRSIGRGGQPDPSFGHQCAL